MGEVKGPDRRFSRIRLSRTWLSMDWLRPAIPELWRNRASRAGLRPAHLFDRRSTVRSESEPRPAVAALPGAKPCGTTRTLMG